jgi:4a-hydroxytetrahydrobiopterin dehydratase
MTNPCLTEALSAEVIHERMETLSSWQVKDNALERVYNAGSYVEGLEKLNAIAQLSEAENHHPELTLAWRKLTVRYWTHTAHGITQLDFQLARKAEAILSSRSSS